MIKRVVGDLGSMLAYAQERGTVAQNVVRSLSRGKKGKHTDRRHKHRLKVGEDIPAPDEIKAIIAKLDGRYRPLLLTAIFAGLRASELRGLKWDDVDLKAAVIHVRQRADKFHVIGNLKSKSSHRDIPIGPYLLNTLRQWKLRCHDTEPNDLVFYASLCINRVEDGGLGLPIKVVQHRLGHSSITMTSDIYGHLFPSGDDGAELAAAEKALVG